MLNAGLPFGSKLFEEVDKPIGNKIVFEDKQEDVVKRETTWTGDIKGHNSFPSGKASGSGSLYIEESLMYHFGYLRAPAMNWCYDHTLTNAPDEK